MCIDMLVEEPPVVLSKCLPTRLLLPILLVPVPMSTPPSSVISCEAYLPSLILLHSSYDTMITDSAPQSKFFLYQVYNQLKVLIPNRIEYS